MTRSIAPAYRFAAHQKRELVSLLGSVKANPYSDFVSFKSEIRDLVACRRVPDYLLQVCDEGRRRNLLRQPVWYLQNCPNDDERPIFDVADPVVSKRRLKRTFVAEGLLELLATLLGTETITYKNDNEGDFFHDVYPMKAMLRTQSQKSIVTLGFHADSANHFARPRCINMICMRNPDANTVLNTFVANADAIACLSTEVQDVLRQSSFFTPYDDLTLFGDQDKTMEDPGFHPLLADEACLSYFENRTIARDDVSKAALAELTAALHRVKYSQPLAADDFVCVENNLSLHGRDVVEVRDLESHKTRWMIKSYSVDSLLPYQERFVPGRYGVVDG